MSKLIFGERPKDSLEMALVFEDDKVPFHGAPKHFKGKKLEGVYIADKSTVVIGLGLKKDVKIDYYRRAGAKAAKIAAAFQIPVLHFLIGTPDEKICNAMLEGALLGNYSFDKYKNKDEKNFELKHISFPKKAEVFSKRLHETITVCANVFLVRDLVSDNSNVVTPELLEKFSRKVAQKAKLKFSVLQKKDLKRLGMNLLLGVGQGAVVPPRLIILEYNGDKASSKKIMFVGKGITFDSGGLNIKVGESMKDMRMDMAGAATVLGIIKTASELNMKKNIVVLMACAENLVDSNSQRPGDVLKSYSGLTVENLNTDAEGSLVLGDALAYGNKTFKPELIVEYSTLTGAVMGTFGSHCAGMISNSDKYASLMFDSGMDAYERVWRLPLFEEYLDETKGDRGDLRSIGKTRYNGTIFGGAFLTKFVGETPFIHLDVAGTAMLEEPKDYMPKDGSGFGLRLAINFLEKI